jgi:hypothetical protein
MRIAVRSAPLPYERLVAPLPPDVAVSSRASKRTDLVHLFAVNKSALKKELGALRKTLSPQAVVWVSWPKKASKVPTDITEDIIREACLPLGFVDVKVCAVNETWSGLKLVVRKALRPAAR